MLVHRALWRQGRFLGRLHNMTPAGNIIVEVAELQSNDGKVACALFTPEQAATFPGTQAVREMMVPITNRKAICRFEDLKKGFYAIAVFHDENDNGKLDTNFLGIPIEGAGASNGAQGWLLPPKFDDARFEFTGGEHDIKINVNYWKGFAG